MDNVSPKFGKDAFHCPFCGAYAHMQWESAYNSDGIGMDVVAAICAKCGARSIWLYKAKRMIHPTASSAPPCADDMPCDVRADYEEAAAVASVSPRAAAALLRLALQKLCVHLGQPGKNIHDDIRELAKNNVLPQMLIKVADTVRIAGNNAVHPGEMSAEDVDLIASKMFLMLNLIVVKGITEPQEMEALLQMVPEGARAAAEAKDAVARQLPTAE